MWPHAWPMPGRASYSALRMTSLPPEPDSAEKAVSRPKACGTTVWPSSVRSLTKASWALCSSYASSGFAWIYGECQFTARVFDVLVRLSNCE